MRNPDRAHLAQGHDQEGGGCRRPRLAPARWRLRPSAGLQPRTHGAPCGPRAPMWPLRPLAAPAVTLAPRARLTIPRHYLLLTTHYSLLTTHYSLGPRARLPRHSLLLTTYYSLLTTHYSLLTTAGPRARLPRGEIAHTLALRARRAPTRRGLGHRSLPRVHLLAALLQVGPPHRLTLILTLTLTLTPTLTLALTLILTLPFTLPHPSPPPSP